VTPAPLYSFEHTGRLTGRSEWPSASHRSEGIILATATGVGGVLGERSITDIAPTAIAFAEVEPPQCDGTVIDAIAGDRALSSLTAGVRRRPDRDISRSDEDFMSEHLRELGYLE
jgi:hypothetical protein